jgi:hypothetical protein
MPCSATLESNRHNAPALLGDVALSLRLQKRDDPRYSRKVLYRSWGNQISRCPVCCQTALTGPFRDVLTAGDAAVMDRQPMFPFPPRLGGIEPVASSRTDVLRQALSSLSPLSDMQSVGKGYASLCA